jgi:hypothetical protein
LGDDRAARRNPLKQFRVIGRRHEIECVSATHRKGACL